MSRTSTASHGKSVGWVFVLLGVVFGGVGVWLYLDDPAASLASWQLTFPGIGVLSLVIGFWAIARGVREDRVLKSGIAGEATVVKLEDTGSGVGGGGDPPGPVTPIYKVHLRVELPGHQPYEAVVREIVEFQRLFELQPGTRLPVRANPRKLAQVVIDWSRRAAVASTLASLIPAAAPPSLPSLTLTGTETPQALRAAVQAVGAAGTAVVDACTPAGTTPDGRAIYLLGMWITMADGARLRVDNTPNAVDPAHAHKVVVGASVPVRVALAGGAQATVLLWDEA
jgi:hypothetical protein